MADFSDRARAVRRDKKTTFWQKFKAGFQGDAAAQNKYLDDAAASNEAAEKIRQQEEEDARRRGMKNRKPLGY